MAKLPVTVCYATSQGELWRDLEVEEGTTIGQAIERSGILQEVPGFDLAQHAVGLYGKKRPLETVVRARDRIELYRPLVADPKTARRRRTNRGTPDGSV